MSISLTVVGGGSWGTALANLMADKGLKVSLLLRDEKNAQSINEQHENKRYLPGLKLNPGLKAYTEPEPAFSGIDICIMAVPCQEMRSVLQKYHVFFPPAAHIVCASKGIEIAGVKRMSEVTAECLPGHTGVYAILSGPSFAREVLEGKPTAVVLGCADTKAGEYLRGVFSTNMFRVYSSTDLVGVELGGAIKNVMAIAAGISDGLDLGHNARAALITRGLAEIARLGDMLGARPVTFMGLSGMGDLVLTCTGDLSRNRQVGMRLAKGETLAEISANMHMVAEGVKTANAVKPLAERLGVDLPIAGAVNKIITEGAMPFSLVQELMTRTLREE